jgi:hypothetical protein
LTRKSILEEKEFSRVGLKMNEGVMNLMRDLDHQENGERRWHCNQR